MNLVLSYCCWSIKRGNAWNLGSLQIRCQIRQSIFQFWLLSSNEENVEGVTHKHVVELIKSGGTKLSLVVLSLPPSEVRRLDPPEDGQAPEYFDYSDKKQILVTIPETRQIENGREKYAVRVISDWFFRSIIDVTYGSVSRLRVLLFIKLHPNYAPILIFFICQSFLNVLLPYQGCSAW